MKILSELGFNHQAQHFFLIFQFEKIIPTRREADNKRWKNDFSPRNGRESGYVVHKPSFTYLMFLFLGENFKTV